MFCEKCGQQIREGQKFCPKCGVPVRDEVNGSDQRYEQNSYMNYQERTYQQGNRYGHLFQRGYCGLSFGTGYEFRITRKVSGVFRLDMLTADWFDNPDARLSNTDGDDDGVDHSWFKNNITFLNIGFAVQFGR